MAARRRAEPNAIPEVASVPLAPIAHRAKRLGDMAMMLRVMDSAAGGRVDTLHHRRQLVADLCRLLGAQIDRKNVSFDRPAISERPAPDTAPSPKDIDGTSEAPDEMSALRRVSGPKGWQPQRGVAPMLQVPSSQLLQAPSTPDLTSTPDRIAVPPAPASSLSPRLRQTLQGLLAGDAEKQIARRLSLSPHTVHVYVKALYRHYGVCSKGELLARFVRRDGTAG